MSFCRVSYYIGSWGAPLIFSYFHRFSNTFVEEAKEKNVSRATLM